MTEDFNIDMDRPTIDAALEAAKAQPTWVERCEVFLKDGAVQDLISKTGIVIEVENGTVNIDGNGSNVLQIIGDMFRAAIERVDDRSEEGEALYALAIFLCEELK